MSLHALAERWIDTRNTAKPSANTAAARRQDLAAIGEQLSGESAEGEEDRLAGALCELTPGELDRRRLERAFSAYAKTRSAASTRRAMSTWRQFCLWHVREGKLDHNPLDLIEAPKRGSWQPKPLQPEALEAIAIVVATSDETARTAWPAATHTPRCSSTAAPRCPRSSAYSAMPTSRPHIHTSASPAKASKKPPSPTQHGDSSGADVLPGSQPELSELAPPPLTRRRHV